MRHLKLMLAMGTAMMLACQTEAASDGAGTGSEVEAINARTAEVNARTAEINAQASLAKAKLDALGLAPAKGETKLGTNAGVMEGWMLSAATLRITGQAIATAVKPHASKVILLTGGETFDAGAAVMLREQMNAIASNMENALILAGCNTQQDVHAQVVAPILAGIGAVAGLIKNDTEITGFTLNLQERALVNAIAATQGATWIIPGETFALDGAKILADLAAAMKRRTKLAECRAQHANDKAIVAQLDAALTDANTFYAKVVATGSDGQSPLTRAAMADALMGIPMLRVSIEQAGGSVIKRTNIWTAIGFESVRLTGGLVTSYRLVQPSTGAVASAGIIVCRTAFTTMRDVQSGVVNLADQPCSGSITTPSRSH